MFSVSRKNSTDRMLPSRNNNTRQGGKMKLREKRMLKLNIERKKAQENVSSIDRSPGISPGLPQKLRVNAATPTKVWQ
jgi:hypothetical protein